MLGLKRREALSKTDKILRFMRCFEECIQSLTSNRQKSFPLPVSFHRSKIYFKIDDAAFSSSLTSSSSTQDTNMWAILKILTFPQYFLGKL